MSAHAQQLAALQTSLQYIANPEAAAAAVASAGSYGNALPGPQSFGGPSGIIGGAAGGAAGGSPARPVGPASLGVTGKGQFSLPSGSDIAKGEVLLVIYCSRRTCGQCVANICSLTCFTCKFYK